jgi:hypothetical protein
MKSVVVFGGYGTFGAHVARELTRFGLAMVIAGRDADRARAFAETLGPGHRGLAADVTDFESCRAALAGQEVAVNCAGPFSAFGTSLLDACLEIGCHYADIADDRNYTALVRSHDERFRRRGLTAVYGGSSLPSISGALGLSVRQGSTAVPRRARVTLFIGNDNPRGGAAISSLVQTLGQPIQTPQRIVKGFRDREVVPLPLPFGPRAVFNFQSPEYDLFPALLGVTSVSVKVGFESRLATYGFAFLAATSLTFGRRTTRFLEGLGNRFRTGGTSGGAVTTELFYEDGTVRRATLLAATDGQRMAALPCALAVRALCDGTATGRGVMTAYEFLGAKPLLEGLMAAGFELHRSSS